LKEENESEVTQTNQEFREKAVFIVHALKRLSYGFDRLDTVADVEDGSPMKAFYLDGIYNYLAAFFLLDAKKYPPGGAFHQALRAFGLDGLLDPIRKILNSPLGDATFGEVVRAFRNEVLVHTSYGDFDLEPIYDKVDMLDPEVQATFRERLEELRTASNVLAKKIAAAAGFAPGDLGLE